MLPCGHERQPISAYVHDESRVIFVTLTGPVTGDALAEAISRLFVETPELAAYDMIYDLSDYTGDVCSGHVNPIATAYAKATPDRSLKPRTAFITPDRNFHLWAAAMDHQFPGRQHRAFRRADLAMQFIQVPSAARREWPAPSARDVCMAAAQRLQIAGTRGRS